MGAEDLFKAARRLASAAPRGIELDEEESAGLLWWIPPDWRRQGEVDTPFDTITSFDQGQGGGLW